MAYTLPFKVEPITYDEALRYLDDIVRIGISPMLETVEDMLAELGNPDLAFRSIQIAGTNGKTSTSRYCAAILRSLGYKTALYTSPHLVHYPERMEIDGDVVSQEDFAYAIAIAAKAGQRVNNRREKLGLETYDITEFDTITVGALALFALKGVKVCVLECGMGGRWDATSACKSIESVAITGIGLDHIHILGDTLEAIAAEKAAIIKPGRTVTLGVGCQAPASVEDVFLDACKLAGTTPVLVRPERPADAQGLVASTDFPEHDLLPQTHYLIDRFPGRIGGSLIFDVNTPYKRYEVLGALKPGYQAANIACALTVCEQFQGSDLPYDKVERAIVSCPIPGRFDIRCARPLILIDAAHNPQSIEAFLADMRRLDKDPTQKPALLCAILKDKDAKTMVRLLSCEFDEVYVTQTDSPRAMPADQLAQLFDEVGLPPRKVFSTVKEAVIALKHTDYVAAGSITLAGEVAGLLGGSGQGRGSNLEELCN